MTHVLVVDGESATRLVLQSRLREGGYVLLFGQAGVAADQAVAMSLLFYALNLVTGLVGGALYLWQGARGYTHHH